MQKLLTLNSQLEHHLLAFYYYRQANQSGINIIYCNNITLFKFLINITKIKVLITKSFGCKTHHTYPANELKINQLQTTD